MIKALILAAAVLSAVVFAQAQAPLDYTNYQCPDGSWTLHTITFNVGYGGDCCEAGAKICSRVVNGQLEVFVGAVYVVEPCDDDLTFSDLKNAALSYSLQLNQAPFNQFTIPPCGQQSTFFNVTQSQGLCMIKIVHTEPRVVGGMVQQVDVTYYLNCYELICLKSCSICATSTDDPCNEGNKMLTIVCQTMFVPQGACPGGACQFYGCGGN